MNNEFQRLREMAQNVQRGVAAAGRLAESHVPPPPLPSSTPDCSAWQGEPIEASYSIEPRKTWWMQCRSVLVAMWGGLYWMSRAIPHVLTGVFWLAVAAGTVFPLAFLCASDAWLLAVILLVGVICAPHFGIPFMLLFSVLIIIGMAGS